MISVCLPSDAPLQHPPSYLGFSYLGHRVSLHGCSSKAQLLLFTLDEGYLLTAVPPDIERGVAPLSPPAPAQPLLLGRWVAPLGCRPWPRTWGSSSWPLPLGHGVLPASAPDLGREVAPLARPRLCAVAATELNWCLVLEKGMAAHSSTFAWGIAWTEEPGRL